MNTTTSRLVALSLGLVTAGATTALAAALLQPNLVGACLQGANEQVVPSPARRLSNEGPDRNAQVLAELEWLGEHPWAGVYRTAGTWPDEWAIAPRAGFTRHEGSWCGNGAFYSAVGTVRSFDAKTLKLGMDVALDYCRSEDTLHLVRWADLLFAIPEQGMEIFCAEVSDGASFPKAPFRLVGDVPDFDFEAPPRPEGMPEVPVEFRALLPEQPITCGIGELLGWERRPELDGEENPAYDASFSIGAGSAQGLTEGMRLFVNGAPHWMEFRGRVEHVAPLEARMRLLVFEDKREWAEGLPGTEATTRDPKLASD